MATQNDKVVAEKEQEEKDETRFSELIQKTDRTEDENKELGDLREKYKKTAKTRIDKLTWERKVAQEERDEERRKREETEARLKEFEDKQLPLKTEVKEEYIEIGGKKYFTDASLLSQVNAGQISEAEAIVYQRKRDREETITEFEKRQTEKEQKKENDRIRQDATKKLLAKYPHFFEKHKDFDSENPQYKRFIYYFNRGYGYHPEGVLHAMQDMERDFNIQNTLIDRTEDLTVGERNIPERKSGKEKEEITLDADEEMAAIRMYCRGDVPNPKTKRPYTEQEALAKALEAKKARGRK